MLKFILITLFLFNLHAESFEGKYSTNLNTNEYYELNMNETNGENGFILKRKMKDASSEKLSIILGNFKLDNKKILFYPEKELEQVIQNETEQPIQEKKYSGKPIRVHVQNKDNKTTLILNSFGKILKLTKE